MLLIRRLLQNVEGKFISRKGFSVRLLLAVIVIIGWELIFRIQRYEHLAVSQNMHMSAGYTGAPVTGFANSLFDANNRTPEAIEALLDPFSIEHGTKEQGLLYEKGNNSRTGIFLENRDNSFWWFGRNGKIRHENNFHLNNIGLISTYDYNVERTEPSFRIVVLGAELTAATTADKSWPDHLQDILNKNDKLTGQHGPIEVINFGWPDAGFDVIRKVWFKKAKKLKPDLLIINIAEHLFVRMSNPDARAPSGPKSTTFWEPFDAPNGLRAWLIVSCYGDGRRLRDPDCNTGRPFGLFLPKVLARDAKSLAVVQDQIVFDYLGRLIWNDWRLTWVLELLEVLENPLEVRTFKGTQKVAVIPPPSVEMKLKNAAEHLLAIFNDFSNMLVISNRHFSELSPKPIELPLMKALHTRNPDLRIVDMVDHLPMKTEQVDAWYQTHVAAEKWSERGHLIYARSVSEVLLKRLGEAENEKLD